MMEVAKYFVNKAVIHNKKLHIESNGIGMEIFLIYRIFTSILYYYKPKSEILQPPKYLRYLQNTEVDNPKSRIIHLSETGRLRFNILGLYHIQKF